MTKIDIAALRNACAKLADEQEWMSDYEAFAYRNIPALLDRIEELEGENANLQIGLDWLIQFDATFDLEEKVRERAALTQKEPT